MQRSEEISSPIIPLAVIPAAAMGKLSCVVRASDPRIRHLQRERLQIALRERPGAERVQLSDDPHARCVSVNNCVCICTHTLAKLLLMCMSRL